MSTQFEHKVFLHMPIFWRVNVPEKRFYLYLDVVHKGSTTTRYFKLPYKMNFLKGNFHCSRGLETQVSSFQIRFLGEKKKHAKERKGKKTPNSAVHTTRRFRVSPSSLLLPELYNGAWHLNAEFQRARRGKKALLRVQCKNHRGKQ